MFERMLAPRPRLGRWPALIIGASVAVHVAVAAGLLIKSAWAVELLPLNRDDGRLTYYSAARPPGAPAPAPAPAKPTLAAEKKTEVRDVVQPDDTPPPAETPATSATVSPAVPGAGSSGDGFAIGVAPSGDGGGCPLPPCLALPTPPPPPPPEEPVAPRIIPDSELRAARIAGDTAIAPPDQVVADMARDGTERVEAVAKVCLDPRGAVSSVELLRRTGYPAYDRRLLQKMNAWRYRPHQVGGKAVPVCTVVRFVFRLR